MIRDLSLWNGIGICVTGFLFLALSQSKAGADLRLSSPAFQDNQLIPVIYTCKGKDINPPLELNGIPDGTQTLALIVDDPDAPMGTWVHWVVFNIAPQKTIDENSIPGDQAFNDFGRKNYGGPCPPSGIHRYFFKVYALDTRLQDGLIKDKTALEKALKGHILAQAQLIGRFGKM